MLYFSVLCVDSGGVNQLKKLTSSQELKHVRSGAKINIAKITVKWIEISIRLATSRPS